MTTKDGNRRFRRPPLSPVVWIVIAVLLGAVPALIFGSVLTAAPRRVAYTVKADSQLGQSGTCVSASQSGTLFAQTGFLLGWWRSTLIEPSAQVTVTDCATGKPAAIDELTVSYSWAEAPCSLWVYSWNSDRPGYQPRSLQSWGTPKEARHSCPVKRVASRLITTETPVQRWTPGSWGDLQFRGWSWSSQMCMRPVVTIQAKIAGRTHNTTLTPPDVCASR